MVDDDGMKFHLAICARKKDFILLFFQLIEKIFLTTSINHAANKNIKGEEKLFHLVPFTVVLSINNRLMSGKNFYISQMIKCT